MKSKDLWIDDKEREIENENEREQQARRKANELRVYESYPDYLESLSDGKE